MRALTIVELMLLTRVQLLDHLARITNVLPDLPEGSLDRDNALISLRNIRYVLAWRDLRNAPTPRRHTEGPAGGSQQDRRIDATAQCRR